MVTSTELRWRTLDELVDSVRIDLKAYSSDGNIEIQELIKVVQKCNYELGLGITQTKETILEIEHGRAKLPNDFHFLNFALLCHQFRVIQPTANSGNMTVEEVVCVNTSGDCSGTTSCDITTCDTVCNPLVRNSVYTICDNTIGIKVIQVCSTECREYEYFSPVYMTPSRYTSAFMNPQRNSMNAPNQAMLKGGFIQFVIPCGTVYINYQGIMEDEQGNLLVLDHPKINMYYEWALKKTVIENLYINGEPDLERRLQYVNTEYQKAKIDAITITNTPDHRVMNETFQIIRKNAAQRFAAPVSRFYGTFAGISFRDRWANGCYAE